MGSNVRLRHSWGVGSDTYYDILGLSPTASQDEIKRKYRKLIQRIHPDLDGPAALFRQVQQAYEELSDPARRASYDRLLDTQGGSTRRPPYHPKADSSSQSGFYRHTRESQTGSGPGPSATSGPTNGSASGAPGWNPVSKTVGTSSPHRHHAGVVAVAGAFLLVSGAALGEVGGGLILVGSLAVITAAVAGLGGRGAKERDAYLRSGMAAVDAMTGRQFEVLLQHFFANKGYRVARIGGRGDFGADLLLDDSRGRTIVQARRWTGVVRHDAVQRAALAMAHYGVARALVVTSSSYSPDAVTVANTEGVTLWDRATLAAELSVFSGEPLQHGLRRFSSDLRAGSRICLGFLAALLVGFVAASTKASRRAAKTRRA